MKKPSKRTAHVDDPSKPGTSINVETELLIAKGDVIREFCDEKAETKRRVGKINDGFNKSATKKVEGAHLHRAAANDAYALQAMEDKELHEYLYHFLFYVKDLGLLKRAQAQEELFAAGETGPSPTKDSAQTDIEDKIEEEDRETDETSSARRVGAAARKVAEAAGARLHGD